MTIPTFDFSIPLDINNIESKNQILELWEKAKNESLENNREIITHLEQIIQLDDSLYGVWYNLGVAKEFRNGICFEKAIELKFNHIESWKGKAQNHDLKMKLPYGDDNLDLYLNLDAYQACWDIIDEIEKMENYEFPVVEPDDADWDTRIMDVWVEMLGWSWSPEGYLKMGLTLMKYSKFKESNTIFDVFLEIESDTIYEGKQQVQKENLIALSYFFKGINFRKLNDYKRSLEMFEKVLTAFPNEPRVNSQKQLTLIEMDPTHKKIDYISNDSPELLFDIYKDVYGFWPQVELEEVEGLYNFSNYEKIQSTLQGEGIPEEFKKLKEET